MSNGSTQPPGPPRRLTRSSRDRMWAGVAGGLGEYFDVDPVLIRLIWVAATIVTGGVAIPLYIVMWIIMPRDDRVFPSGGAESWRAWTDEFRAETQRVAAEARRVADDVTGRAATAPAPEPSGEPVSAAVAGEGVAAEVGAASSRGWPPTSSTAPTADQPTVGSGYEPYGPPAGWEPRWRHHGYEPHHRQRTAGLILVGLGLIFLASQAGLFAWIQWSFVWPLVLVAIGLSLLLRRADWR